MNQGLFKRKEKATSNCIIIYKQNQGYILGKNNNFLVEKINNNPSFYKGGFYIILSPINVISYICKFQIEQFYNIYF